MNNLSKSTSPYINSPVPEKGQTLANDYNSAISELSELEAVESIQLAKNLLLDRLNEKVLFLQKESEQSAKQAEFVSTLINRL